MEAGLEMQMDGCGIVDHEGIGADFVRDLGFSARVAKLVRNHVSAKRYLCATNPEYHATLSEASKTTLRFQGQLHASCMPVGALPLLSYTYAMQVAP
jgi:predicted HD phosphohydrolase